MIRSAEISLEDFILMNNLKIDLCECNKPLKINDFGYYTSAQDGHLYAIVKFDDCCKRENSFQAVPANSRARGFWATHVGDMADGPKEES